MKFCEECGEKLKEKAKFCPECGTPTSVSKKSTTQPASTDDYKTQIRGGGNYGVVNLEQLPIGHIIEDRYEVKSKIGQGGFGAVYRVFDKNMNIDKALKIIPEAVSSDKEAMFDLQNEAQTMIALNSKNIVRVYDFHKTGKIKFIDMEFVDGKTLTEIKLEHKNKQVAEGLVQKLALQIATGLSYAHQNSILHKDIKPQNVMVNKDNEVKIMDFGIAETVRTSMSRLQNSSSSGTLVYMSPEQIKGKDVGKESDIYSFGAMLYELLNGNPPFYKGDINYQILNELPKKLENVSKELNELILKCLAKSYKDRFRNFGEVIKFLGGTTVKHTAVKLRQPQSSKLKSLANVSIVTVPAAEIMIDNKKHKTPFDGKLTTATHHIKISKEGYATIEDEIVISENSSNDFYIELESTMGSITVETAESGQQIWLNAELTDYNTPHTFENIIPNKEYVFSVTSEFYYSENTKITIKEKEHKTVKLETIKYAVLEINSNLLNANALPFEIGNETFGSNESIKLKMRKYADKTIKCSKEDKR